MKLYTEFELKFAMDVARCQPDRTFDDVLEELTPIELPSDEEIYHSASDWVFRKNPTKWSVNDDTAGDNMGSFINGARLIMSKIEKTSK